MTTLFLWCGVLGGAVLILQLVAGVFGLAGLHDHDLSHPHEGSEGLSLLSIRAVAAGLAFFGIAGLAARSLGAPVALAVALAAGFSAAIGVTAMIRVFRRFERDGTLALESAVGSTGTVYLSVPGRRSGVGKVHITVQNRLVECRAVTTDDSLPTGAPVLVIDLESNDTVVVVRNPILLSEVPMLPFELAAVIQDPGLGISPLTLAGPVLGAVVVLGMLILFASRYRRCPANRVLVISGKVGGEGSARCISGGGAFVWPVIQEYAYLSLEPIQIDIPLKDALSFENIRVAVPSVCTVAIGTEDEVRQNAAIRLLGLPHDQIKRQSQDIIFGQFRQVIASMKIEEINRDREAFLHRIQSSLEPELKKIGLVLINVNITDLKDESGYIEAIGKKAAATAVQQARGDVAEQEKLGEIRVAEAERDRSVQVASATKSREIGMREAERDKLVRVAELEKEQKFGETAAALEREALIKQKQREQAVLVAELDKEQRVGEQRAAFERDAQVKDAERQRRVAVASAEAAAIAGEAESQAAMAAARAQLSVREAEAYQLSETKKREAEAAVKEAQNRAMAKAAIAEAERVEAERRAAVEAPARAEKAKTIVEAEAAAERRRIEAEAEARAIYIKLEAEARGQYEILAKKAEAMKELVQAAGGAKEAFQLLMVEHLDQLAETSAKAISNIKFDKVVVWDSGNGGASASGFLQSMAKTLPPMMHVLRDIADVELPGLGKLAPDVDGTSGERPVVAGDDSAVTRRVSAERDAVAGT